MLYADDVLEDLQDRWDEYEDGISKYLNQPIFIRILHVGLWKVHGMIIMWNRGNIKLQLKPFIWSLLFNPLMDKI